MSFPTVHFNITAAPKGYIKNSPQFACGIESKLDDTELDDVVQTSTPFFSQVTCDWCRLLHRKRKTKSMSAHDTEKAIAEGVQKGVDQAVAKIAKDFFESDAVGTKLRGVIRSEMHQVLESPRGQTNLVRAVRIGQRSEQDQVILTKRALRESLQNGEVRKQLVDIAKIADDEIEAEYEGSEAEADYNAERKEATKEAVREVLEEQSGVGVGTQFVQNIYGESLIPANVIRETKNLKTAYRGSQNSPSIYSPLRGINVSGDVIEDFPQVQPLGAEMTHTVVVEALEEFFDESASELEEGLAEDRLNLQRAIRDMMELPGFQRQFKNLVKAAVEEDRQAEHDRALEFNRKMWDRLNASFFGPSSPIITLPEKAAVHHRRFYTDTTACGLDASAGESTQLKGSVSCKSCRRELNI